MSQPNQRKGRIVLSIVVVVITIGAVAGMLISHAAKPAQATTQESQESTAPTDTVTTAPLKLGDISATIVAFGSITAPPGDVGVFSVPYECRVKQIHVSAGQAINKGDSLIDIEPSPLAKLALKEAQSNLEVSKKDLDQTQQRFNLKLATNSELLQSQQTVELAQTRLTSQTDQGATEDHRQLQCDQTGLVAKVDVQQGQIVPAGSPLVETIASSQMEVRLGVEPSQMPLLKVGQDVQLQLLNGATDESFPGKIRLINQRINPDTRLVDVMVTTIAHDGLLLDGAVRAELHPEPKTALIAPHDAVLPDDQGLIVFTVKDGHAVKHTVTIGIENNHESEITSPDLHAGDQVVITGNLELEDGMAVTQQESK